MAKKIGRIVLIVIFVILLLAAVTALVSPSLVRNTAKKSFPSVDGEIRVTGINSKVEIYRDAYGIPHIYGDSHHDLFFAQGYVHAQDRFWQMDFQRHQSAEATAHALQVQGVSRTGPRDTRSIQLTGGVDH